MISAMDLMLALGTVLLILAPAQTVSNTGNKALGTLPMMDITEAQRLSLVADVATYFDQALANEIAAATHPQTGTIVLRDLWSGDDGAADSGTVAVDLNTGKPPVVRTIVLVHEYFHAKRAREGDPGNPDARDPLTNPTLSTDSCWMCRHAMLTASDCQELGGLLCEPPLATVPESGAACESYKKLRESLESQLGKCWKAMCPSCCGFNYVPLGSELVSQPPCCTWGPQ